MKSEGGLYGNDTGLAGAGWKHQEPSSGGPGWQRFQNRGPGMPLIDVDTGTIHGGAEQFFRGDRCFHQKFGMGVVNEIDGDHLTIDFDKAGTKKVVAAFVEKP